MQVYFDTQEGVPTSFESEVVSWLPTDNLQNQTQTCIGSEPSCIQPMSRYAITIVPFEGKLTLYIHTIQFNTERLRILKFISSGIFIQRTVNLR